MDEVDAALTATPQSMEVSSGSVKLWAVSTNTSALYSFLDELTKVGPTLIGPRDGTLVEINPVSGVAYDVAFTWERPSKAKIYDLKIALDPDFLETLSASTTTSSTTDAEIAEVIEGKYFMPETTYYWRVRVNIDGPVKSQYSSTRSFSIGALPEAMEPVVIEQPPAPVISVPPTPEIVIEPPEIVLPAPQPVPEIVIPEAPAAPAPITPAYIWAIIIIGAILVIALVVLIIRTRRPV
jgi:type II secretory pathway pseudopilin PulG